MVYRTLHEGMAPAEALRMLMSRGLKEETDEECYLYDKTDGDE